MCMSSELGVKMLSYLLSIILAESVMATREVKMSAHKATLMTDFDLVDHTDLDQHVQILQHEDWLVKDWLQAIQEAEVVV